MPSVTAIPVDGVGTCDVSACDERATTLFVIVDDCGDARYEFGCDVDHDDGTVTD